MTGTLMMLLCPGVSVSPQVCRARYMCEKGAPRTIVTFPSPDLLHPSWNAYLSYLSLDTADGFETEISWAGLRAKEKDLIHAVKHEMLSVS